MPWLSVDYTHSALEDSQTRDGQGRHPRWPEHRYHSAEMYKQHLDNLRRKDSLTGAETPERAVRLGNYSASHFEGAAVRAYSHVGRGSCLSAAGDRRAIGWRAPSKYPA